MSMGYGARATLVLEDAETAIYTYGGFNWDIPSCKNPDYVQDGLLTIPRDCLPEPEIHARWRRMPSGTKRYSCFPEMPGKAIFRTTPFRIRGKGYILRKC